MSDVALSSDRDEQPAHAPIPIQASLGTLGVAVHEPGEVGAYLSSHPELGRAVEQLSRTARERLGPETSLTLELVRDPETDDGHLTLYARQAAYDLDLIDLLDEILEAHEHDAGPGGGWVTLTTDFQPPR